MKKTKPYRSEKSSIREYIAVHKGIRIPWVLLLIAFLVTLGSTYAGMHIAFFTGDMVDANGNVPTAALVKFALTYLGIGLFAALNYLLTTYAA